MDNCTCTKWRKHGTDVFNCSCCAKDMVKKDCPTCGKDDVMGGVCESCGSYGH